MRVFIISLILSFIIVSWLDHLFGFQIVKRIWSVIWGWISRVILSRLMGGPK